MSNSDTRFRSKIEASVISARVEWPAADLQATKHLRYGRHRTLADGIPREETVGGLQAGPELVSELTHSNHRRRGEAASLRENPSHRSG